MTKKARQQKIAKILKELNVSNQEQLQAWLTRAGVSATQASLSRDLKDLGAQKIAGFYRLPQISPGQSALVSHLKVERAGENLIVFKTDPLHAPVLAALMDRSNIPSLVGTVAGDDTVFAAVSSSKDQARVIKKVISLVQGKNHAEM